MTQHFALFKLEPSFDIDIETLEQTYRSLAARFHPDKYAAASAFEQKQAVMMASAVNEAYRVLKNPTERAAYLLQQHGIEADAPEHTAFAPEFLMQQMEWRETLEEARAGGNTAALAELDEEIAAEQQNLQQHLRAAFSRQNHDEAAALVRQSRFLDKLRQEIQAAS
ncbi:Fe-S protein assembly co-chaperone HscB [Neisseria dentiae]|uniref:Co-chaperone protein HscB homolog n=1 Tax=Neisseria dentiae TaxID=194197 RepID=A0A1X3DCZ9_9NEIS|nr:Fe-S protein assembly co-chaperone HscB [Neisseria dentiae]OSI17686.1 Fe-S protein assembly co-chaperone HscB [Neisseria dentiae]QMT46071.1 Fe-S protein assembly co-chaperone HscB [Neisseria dentiae]STZ52126.1 chaperone protein HscB [Neisseria dentiae]